MPQRDGGERSPANPTAPSWLKCCASIGRPCRLRYGTADGPARCQCTPLNAPRAEYRLAPSGGHVLGWSSWFSICPVIDAGQAASVPGVPATTIWRPRRCPLHADLGALIGPVGGLDSGRGRV